MSATHQDSSQPPEPNGTSETPAPETSVRQKGRPLRKWIARLAVILAIVAGAIVGLQWWQERSVAEASAALQRGDAKYARFLLDKFLERNPGHPTATALQARAMVALGSPDEAIALFDQVGAASADDLHAWAQALMMKGQWSHALPLLKRVLELTPDDPDALYEAASCEARSGRFTDALVHAKKLATIPGQEARGLVFVGTLEGDLGNFAEAAEIFAKVLEYEPEAANLQVAPAEFFLQQGRTSLLLGKPSEALLPLKRSVAARENPEAFVLLGNAALQLGEPKNAAQAWQKAITLDFLNRRAREALANLALQNGRGEEALNWLQPLAGLAELPSSTAFLFQRTHTVLKNDEQIAQWREIADKARKREELNADIESLMVDAPESFWARVARAYRFAEQGNWNEAEVLLKRLLAEAPAEPFVIELADAVYRRAELPPIEKLPIAHF